MSKPVQDWSADAVSSAVSLFRHSSIIGLRRTRNIGHPSLMVLMSSASILPVYEPIQEKNVVTFSAN